MSNLGNGIAIVISFVALSIAILAFQSSPPPVVQTPPESDVGPIVPQNQLSELSDRIATLDMKVSEQLSEIEQLKLLTDQQIDEINKLKIPQIIKRGFTVSGILVDRAAGELIAGIKDRLPGYLHGGVDLATNAVKSLIEAKLGNPTADLLDATRISNDIYAVNAIVSIPIRLAEIPGLSAAQVAIGDITFFIDITISGQVDISSQTVSQIDYRDVMIRV